MKEKKHGLLTNFLRKTLKKSRNDEEMLATLATASKALDEDDLYFVTGGAQYEPADDRSAMLAKVDYSADTKALIDQMISNAVTIAPQNDSGSQDISQITVGFTAQETQYNPNISNVPVNIPQTDNGATQVTDVPIPEIGAFDIPNQSEKNLDIQASVNTGDYQGDVEFRAPNIITDGNNAFTLDSNAQQNAAISVDAGDGFDVMTLFGTALKHSFSYKNGHFHMN